MAKEYLAKYRSRTRNITISFYKEGGLIYRDVVAVGRFGFKSQCTVRLVQSRIPGYEEVGLKDD